MAAPAPPAAAPPAGPSAVLVLAVEAVLRAPGQTLRVEALDRLHLAIFGKAAHDAHALHQLGEALVAARTIRLEQAAAACSNDDCEDGVVQVGDCGACDGPIWRSCPTCAGGKTGHDEHDHGQSPVRHRRAAGG